MALFRKLQDTPDPEERGELLLQLAHQFAENYDPSDDNFRENFHSVVDKYHQAFLIYNQAGLRLGRVLSQILENHIQDTGNGDISLPVTMKPVDPSAN
jgi:hypothetical protein